MALRSHWWIFVHIMLLMFPTLSILYTGNADSIWLCLSYLGRNNSLWHRPGWHQIYRWGRGSAWYRSYRGGTLKFTQLLSQGMRVCLHFVPHATWWMCLVLFCRLPVLSLGHVLDVWFLKIAHRFSFSFIDWTHWRRKTKFGAVKWPKSPRRAFSS